MASQGPRFPGTTASLANAGTSENAEAWVSPGNIVSDNATEASITAATYDSPDLSQLLVASNFTFTVPTDSTVDGITVEVDRRSIIAGSGQDFRAQLAKGTAFTNLVGTNKADTALTWPSTTAVKTYGGAADLWGTTWTPAEVNASSFAFMLTCKAIIANADVGVDFVRVTVNYTLVPVAVAPTAASLTATGATPTVVATDHKSAAPTAASLTATPSTPTVTTTANQLAAPTAAALTTTGAVPAIVTPVGVTTVAGSLTTTGATPTIATPVQTSPTAGSIALTPSTPAVLTPVASSPDAVSLVTTGETPAVVLPVQVTPGLRALTTTLATPTVTIGATGTTVTPSAASLVLTPSTPVIASAARPTAAGLTITGTAPAVSLTQSAHPLPLVRALVLTGARPTVTVSGAEMEAWFAQQLAEREMGIWRQRVRTSPAAGHLSLRGAAPRVRIGDDADVFALMEFIA